MCASVVISQGRFLSLISDWSKDGQAMAGSVLNFSTAAGSLGGQKSKGETPTYGGGTSFTIICPPFCQDREQVKWYCSYTRHWTFYAKGPSEWVCGCVNVLAYTFP